jgi:GAF domain-containing protein
MSAETQAVLFNAVPLLILAALYLAVGLAVAPALWRERGQAHGIGFATALVFPAVGLALAVLGVETLVTQEALTGDPLVGLVGILLAAIPLVAIVRKWRDLGLLVTGARAATDSEQEVSRRDRELAEVGRLSHKLLDADSPGGVARVLLDELSGLFELDVANLALVEDDGRRATLISARDGGRDNEQLIGQSVSLSQETSGISTVVREGAAFAVYDAASSPIVNKRLNEIAQVQSCAFIPVRARGDVIGVIFAAVRRPRLFELDELALMETLASEAGLALERTRSADAVADALERERLIARISRAVRSRRDLDELLNVAVQETAKAAHVERCFIRLGEPGEPTPVLAEWAAPGLPALVEASRLPAVNLAARERRTVAVGDVLDAPELDDPTLGDVSELTDRHVRAVLATPIVAFDRVIGVLGLHRAEPGGWTRSEISLAEAVALEAAIAIDTSRLLRESDRRLAEQQALLKAGEALTSDLRVDVVIDRLVDEMRSLVNGDAAYCWTFAPDGEELVCRAVVGLPESEVGRRIPAADTVGEAISTGTPVLRRKFSATEQPPPTANYASFEAVMDAPILSFGETLGVLGVCSREPDRFDESDLRLIEGFASLASVALRNAEAYEESTRQTQVERGFYRIASVLGEPLSAERRSTRSRSCGGALAASPPPCSAPAATTRSLPAPIVSTGGWRPISGRGSDRARRASRYSHRAGSSTTSHFRARAGESCRGHRVRLTACHSSRSAGGCRSRAGDRLLSGRDGLRRRAARAGGPCRRCSPRRARAE